MAMTPRSIEPQAEGWRQWIPKMDSLKDSLEKTSDPWRDAYDPKWSLIMEQGPDIEHVRPQLKSIGKATQKSGPLQQPLHILTDAGLDIAKRLVEACGPQLSEICLSVALVTALEIVGKRDIAQ